MILRGVISAVGRSLSISKGLTVTKVPALRFSTTVLGVPSKPVYYHSFGIAKVLAISAPFIYIGASTAKAFALYLEDFDLFVPDDDDD